MHLDAIDEVDESAVKDEQILTFGNKPAIFKHKEIVDISQARKDIELAQAEWDQLGSNEGSFISLIPSEPITCEEALHYFKTIDMSQYLKCIKPVKPRRGFDAFKHWLAGPPKLHNSLIEDRNLLFAIALSPFDSTDKIHSRVLQTLHKTLSGTNEDCPRYGKHWEELGFQGVDPGTDLRGVGFLGLMHLLSFALNSSTAELAKAISILAKHDKQNFPFCAMGVNITRIVLEAMREEVLNRECNRTMDVFKVTNDFYAAIFLRLYVIWSQQKKTIMDSGFVIRDLSAVAKRHSSVILRELSTYLKVNQVSDKECNAAYKISSIGDSENVKLNSLEMKVHS